MCKKSHNIPPTVLGLLNDILLGHFARHQHSVLGIY